LNSAPAQEPGTSQALARRGGQRLRSESTTTATTTKPRARRRRRDSDNKINTFDGNQLRRRRRTVHLLSTRLPNFRVRRPRGKDGAAVPRIIDKTTNGTLCTCAGRRCHKKAARRQPPPLPNTEVVRDRLSEMHRRRKVGSTLRRRRGVSNIDTKTVRLERALGKKSKG